MNSGVFVGEVPAYTVMDLTAGYRLPMDPRAQLTLSATNLFDNVHREFIGAPETGRLLLLRLQYSF